MSNVIIYNHVFIGFVLKMEAVWRRVVQNVDTAAVILMVVKIHTFVFQLAQVSESSLQIFL